MLTLFAPLLLAAISGLAYLAVKHPAVYEKLFGKVYLISSIVFCSLVVWSASLSWAHTTLIPFIAPEKYAAAKVAVEAISFPVPWLLLTQALVMVYLFFLAWLAHQVEQDKRAKEAEA